MHPVFPLTDIIPNKVEATRKVAQPMYADSFWQVGPHEFALQVEGIGSFYAANGNVVEYAPANGASQATIELYLNGSVYGAILHQRNILPLHGSCFAWKGEGIMISGNSGAGKSALTASFCMDGAEFLTDDVTPIKITDGVPTILPLSDRIKLWEDSIHQLGLTCDGLVPVSRHENKYYLPMEKANHKAFPLHKIYIIESTNVENLEFENLTGIESFTAIRNEIYRWEYLTAMPETEANYLQQLIVIAGNVHITRIGRPAGWSIAQMKEALQKI